jgi:hypothetical protein
MTSDRRVCLTSPRVLLTVTLIFLAGAVTGGLAMRYGVHSILHAQVPFWQEGGKQVSLQHLTSELDLTPTQQADLETVLDDFVMYVQMLQAQMDDVRANGKARIMRVLDERQKKKFEKMLGELQQVRRK